MHFNLGLDIEHSNTKCSETLKKTDDTLIDEGKQPQERKPSQKKTIENLIVVPTIFNIYGEFW